MKRVSRNGNQCETKIKSLGPGDKTIRQETKLQKQGMFKNKRQREGRESHTHHCLEQWFSNGGEFGKHPEA